jgi:quercetin dioxygenase-like cupin family protein
MRERAGGSKISRIWNQHKETGMKRFIIAAALIVLTSSAALAAEGAGVVVDTLAKTGKSWDGAALPAYGPGEPEITILRIVIPAGIKLPRHYHPVINAGVLIRGELTVRAESGKTLRLKAGEAIVEVVDTWHYGVNEGDGPAEIIVFYAGEAGEPITVK